MRRSLSRRIFEKREAAVTTQVDLASNHPVSPRAPVQIPSTKEKMDSEHEQNMECPGVAFDEELFKEMSSPDPNPGVDVSAAELRKFAEG